MPATHLSGDLRPRQRRRVSRRSGRPAQPLASVFLSWHHLVPRGLAQLPPPLGATPRMAEGSVLGLPVEPNLGLTPWAMSHIWGRRSAAKAKHVQAAAQRDLAGVKLEPTYLRTTHAASSQSTGATVGRGGFTVDHRVS